MMSARDDVRRLLGEGKRQTEIARELGISAGRVSQLVKELGINTKVKNVKESPLPLKSSKQAEKPKTKGGGNKPKPPPGPHSTGFKPGWTGGPGAPKGNDNATKIGENRNPFLHHVPIEDARRAQEQADKSAVELQRDSVLFYDARLYDMTRRMAKLQAQKKEMLTTEADFVRQEGDGELSGTFRQVKRKRKRLDDLIFELHEAITRTQAKRDSAVAKLHDMEQVDKGARKKGLADVLAAMRQGGDEDE